MKTFLSLAAGVALMLAAGCATDRYPVSGEKCSPDDPVRNMTAPECVGITGR